MEGSRLEPLRAALASTTDALRSAAVPADVPSEELTSSLERLGASTDLLERLLVETPETLLTNTLIATLVQQLQQVTTLLPQLAADPPATATALGTAADTVLAALGSWPISPRLDDDAARHIAEALERRANAAARRVEKRIAELEDSLDGLEERAGNQRQTLEQTVTSATDTVTTRATEAQTAIANAKTAADALTPQLQQRFDAAEAAREQTFKDSAARLNDSVNAQIQQAKTAMTSEVDAVKTEVAGMREAATAEKTRLDSLAQQQQQQFAEAQDQRSKEFAAQRDQLVAAAKEQQANAASRATEHIAEMQRILEETERIANAVATTGTATAYGKDAKAERQAADRWRIVAIALGLLAVVFAAITLVWKAPDATGINYVGTVGRFGVSAVLLAVAAYAARQSAHHRRREERSRQIELELTAFGPFVEGLDDTTKRDLRAEYVRRLFRGLDTAQQASQTEADPLNQAQLNPVGQVVDTLTGAIRPR